MVPARAGPWIWGRWIDLLVFGGSAVVALSLLAVARPLGWAGPLPAWGWVLFVLAIDVTHVWTTIFRTYLDKEELARRPRVYAAIPVGCFAAGAALHLFSERAFWRALAYVAVFHFVRQQAGWVAVYRARSGERSLAGRCLDDAVIYLATGWPLLYWHTHLPRAFHWFVEGDFAPSPLLTAAVAPLGAIYAALLGAYLIRAGLQAARGRPNLGKDLVVVTTAATWYAGIVATNSDFEFTVSNVIVHGVPYMALLWAYSKERAREAPSSLVARLAAGGVGAFLGVCLVLAFTEEMIWDRTIWHDRPWLGSNPDAPSLAPLAKALLVPLLAVPQATHYVLDAVLWRRKDTGPAQARALGFADQ